MIYFNRPALVGNELKYIQDAVAQGMLCGDGKYTKLCSAWMKERFQVNQVFLTTSCTHALEMAAFLSDIQGMSSSCHRIHLFPLRMLLYFEVQRSYSLIFVRIR